MTASAQLGEMVAFADFVSLIYAPEDDDWSPYPWQQRFAERCMVPGKPPPSWVVAPTGSGKTIVVDALVWALAAQADVPVAERTASTRVVWAIDRRILVDQVYEHACELADRLDAALDNGSGEDPLYGMAVRLLRLATGGAEVRGFDRLEREARGLRPLVVTRWRGGLARDRTLVSPFQPQVITSTVGQIGSRLLFRGYGVAAGSVPLSTGLAATDTTICLDEAHLAMPFRETVDAIRRRRMTQPDRLPVPDLHLMTLTATPPADYDLVDSVDLDANDYQRLGPRWTGEKSLELRDPAGDPDGELALSAQELVDAGRRVVACVANRVLIARKIRARIAKAIGHRADVLLLMGPQRPADRARQLSPSIRAALFRGEAPERPIVVVATQTIEVGLDADFDGMVTQSASASALIQRLGRLNRSGARPGKCIVIRDESPVLYEDDEPAAWRWLSELRNARHEIDVSVKAVTEDERRPADQRHPIAATLTDAVVTQLTQTSPRPAPMADPDIDPLLAGIGSRRMRDVQVVWRCDLRLEDENDETHAYQRTLLKLVRPQPAEALTLSEQAVKALIRARTAGRPAGIAQLDDADVEGGGREQNYGGAGRDGAPFLVVRGRDILRGVPEPSASEDEITLPEIRAGDTVVVPTSLGGADQFGLNHLHQGRTSDVLPDLADVDEDAGDAAETPIRLSLETFQVRRGARDPDDEDPEAKLQREELAKQWRRIARTLSSREYADGRTLWPDEVARLLSASRHLASLPGVGSRLAWPPDRVWRLRRIDTPPLADADLLASNDGGPERVSEPDDEGADIVENEDPQHIEALMRAAWVFAPVPKDLEGKDETSARADPPTVESHSLAVRERVSRYAARLDLARPQRSALELAALAHDLGKLDPRFQDYLTGVGALPGSAPLAKSTFGTGDPTADRLARRRAGLPDRFRHEARSVAILDGALLNGGIPAELADADHSLALYLTGAHHGRGHPLWPVDVGGRPSGTFLVDLLGVRGRASGESTDGWLGGSWFQLFFDLQDQYGPWILAYLEALFVLADRTVSREGG